MGLTAGFRPHFIGGNNHLPDASAPAPVHPLTTDYLAEPRRRKFSTIIIRRFVRVQRRSRTAPLALRGGHGRHLCRRSDGRKQRPSGKDTCTRTARDPTALEALKSSDLLEVVVFPIESVFATVRHRTVRTKGALSAKTAKLMVFKLVNAVAKTWRRLKGEISCRKSSKASNSKTASRSSKCRLTTPP